MTSSTHPPPKCFILSNYSNWLLARISTCLDPFTTISSTIYIRFRVTDILQKGSDVPIRGLFIILFIPGARRYLMKEPDSSIPACKRRLVKIMIVDRVLRFILFGFIFYKIFMKYNFLGFEDFVMGARNDTIIVKFQ